MQIQNFNFDIIAFDPPDQDLVNNLKSNSIRVLIVLDQNAMEKKDEELLSKIINATGCAYPSEAMIYSLDPYSFLKLDELIRACGISKVICFGLGPKNLGLNIAYQLYKVFDFSKIKLLFSEDLSKLANDAKSKQQLWQSLKEFFQIETNA